MARGALCVDVLALRSAADSSLIDQVERVCQRITPVLITAPSPNRHSQGVQVQPVVHLFLASLHEGIVPLQSLLNRQQEDDVDENDAVGADQVEHLDGLREAGIRAISNVIHLLDEHVAPDVQREHAREQNKAAEDP